MKRLLLIWTASIAAALLSLSAPSAQARTDVSFNFFFTNLQPYGDWVEVENYGYCWQPYAVDSDWSPYTDGYWAYTDCGWTWVSNEDWGWATYHYGRWVRLHHRGWVWVPGYEWGPAWVSWRTSDDYIGWAPLPPEAVWEPSVGFSIWVDTAYDIGPSCYNFVEVRHFGGRSVRPVIIERTRNVTIINNTVNVTKIVNNNTIVYNQGPDFARINRVSAEPVRRLNLVRQTDPSAFMASDGRTRRLARVSGDQLVVAAPEVRPVASERPPRVQARVTDVQVDRGWNVKGVDQNTLNTTRERIRAQNRAEIPKQVQVVQDRQPGAVNVERAAVQQAQTQNQNNAEIERQNREQQRQAELAARQQRQQEQTQAEQQRQAQVQAAREEQRRQAAQAAEQERQQREAEAAQRREENLQRQRDAQQQAAEARQQAQQRQENIQRQREAQQQATEERRQEAVQRQREAQSQASEQRQAAIEAARQRQAERQQAMEEQRARAREAAQQRAEAAQQQRAQAEAQRQPRSQQGDGSGQGHKRGQDDQ